MRCAIYARYSSDRQSEASAEDQARLCRERAASEGWTVVAEFLDQAISGATRDRPRLNAMMAHAADFDVVLCESLDRLSRDQEDMPAIFKRLRFAGVAIVTLADGQVSELHVGLKGTMSQLFLQDLAHKTRRGQIGRVEAGRIPGGLSYGYRAIHAFNDRGEPERGLREIDEAEAAIVRRIFREYLAGIGPREIAKGLNADQVPGPRGGLWRGSTITGHRTRRNGILYNDLYAGRILYNRQRFERDPDTRRRIARPNPRDQWKAKDVPELRIVDEATWSAAQARLERGSSQRPHKLRRPRRLFSGLLECGQCGGPVTIISAEKWGCAASRETGTCGNRKLTANAAIERRVLGALRDDLLNPRVVSEYAAAYQSATSKALARAAQAQDGLKRRAREAEARVKNLVAAIAAGVDLGEVRGALDAASAERDEALAELAELDAARVVTMHPRLADRYRERMAALGEALAGEGVKRAEARELLRGLIERVIVIPAEDGVELELHGRLAEIIGFAQSKTAPEGAVSTAMLVAGARSRLCSPLSIVRV
jgi:site-specific DNA recombinase